MTANLPAHRPERKRDALADVESKLLAPFAPTPDFDYRDGSRIGLTVSDFEHERERWPEQWSRRLDDYRRRAREWMACAPPRAALEQRRAALDMAYKGPPDRNVSRALIGLLLDSFPAGRPADFDRYADAMLHDVVDLGFSPPILARACQAVRRTSRFLPTVAEVITACDEAKGELRLKLQMASLHVRKAEGAEAVLAHPEPEAA